LNQQSKYEEALDLLKQVEAIRLKKLGEKDILTLGARSNVANLAMTMGRLGEAETLFKSCISISEQNGLTGHSFYPNFLGGLALALHFQGRYSQSIEYRNREIEWVKNKYGDKHPRYIEAIRDLATELNDVGKIENADSLLHLEIGYWSTTDDSLQLGISYRRLGIIQSSLGLTEKGRESLFRAKDLIFHASDKVEDRAEVLNVIGANYTSDNNLKAADKYYSAAIDLLKDETHTPYYAILLNHKTEVLLRQHRNQEAGALLKIIEEISQKTELQSIEMTSFLENKATLAKNLNNWEESAHWYDEAVDFEKSTSYNKDVIANLRKAEAVMYASFGKNKAAIAMIKEALEIRKSTVIAMIAILSDHQRQKISTDLESDFSLFANLLARTPADSADIAEIVNLELFYKNLLEYASKKTQSVVLNSGDSTLLTTYAKWLDLREQINYGYQLPEADAQMLHIDVNQLEQAAQSLEKTFAHQGLYQIAQEKDINWTAIRDALGPKEAAVNIVRFQLLENDVFRDTSRYLVAIIRAGMAQPEILFLDNGNELESFIAGQYQSEISRKKDISAGIYNKIWAPIAAHLDGISTIYFSPDGIFHKINLNTLRKPDGAYLLEGISVKLVTNIRHILERNSPTSGTDPGMAAMFGNPAFQRNNPTVPTKVSEQNYREMLEDLKGNFDLTPLPGSEREVRDIAQKLDGKKWTAVVFTGAEATEDTLKKLKSPKVLHLATHGYFMNTEKQADFTGFTRARADKNPALRSMLFFTGAEDAIAGKRNTQLNDGILTAYEASVLQLDGTELVVLSACNTGLGKIQHGEGVYGLQRAFRIAGAKSLIMSLWEVEDAATALLMTTFYENWTLGMSKTDAFRKAQLALKAKYPQPFYWGSFVLVNG
jgi:CHAT domain-containing protein